jgi:photosystem II stability/assembly factor-like uncharacterized protein
MNLPPNPVVDPLRDALRHPTDLPPVPDPDEMLRRIARARRRRANTLASGVALLAVVALATGTAVARRPDSAAPAPGAPASAMPTISPSSSALPNLAPGLALSVAPWVWFADANHVFTVLTRCSAAPETVCTLSVAATADGGQRWQVHPVPGTIKTRDRPYRLPEVMRVLDASRIVMQVSPPVFSADAGATWTTLPEPNRVVDTIPVGGAATIVVNAGGTLGVVVLLPDGTTARLAHAPAGAYSPDYADAYVRMSADGSAWISASDGQSAQRVFVSRDRGRTWDEIHMPKEADLALLSTDNGRTVFLVDPKRDDLWRSVDGGKHWVRMPLPFNHTSNLEMAPFLDRGDGSLLIGDTEKAQTYLLAPDSNEFQLLPWDEHLRATRIGAGYLQQSDTEAPTARYGGSPSAFLISADRVHWTTLPFEPKPFS